MRVCHARTRSSTAFAGVDGPTLVDRFLENGRSRSTSTRSATASDTYIGAIMQHVEEAGVHSGDSACVLPAQSLSGAASAEIAAIVKRLGPALGVVGLLNVQLAVVDDEVFVLEVNPRASRTVPFASKATGVNLVAAACRLAAGETIADLGLPAERPPRQVSVKAAVLPFARFPGADPVLGPEMRATGEVMASASDLPTAFAKAERAAGRSLPHDGAVFLSVRDDDKAAAIPVAAALAGLGFQLVATRGTARTLRGAGLDVEEVRKVNTPGDEAERRRPDPARALQPRRQHARGRLRPAHRRLPDPRGGARGAHPVHHDDRRRRRGRARDRERARRRRRSRSRSGSMSKPRRERRSVAAVEAVGPYALVRVERGSIDPGVSRAVLHARGARARPAAPDVALSRAARRARVPARPDRPGHARACGARGRRRIARLRPARQRLPPRRRATAARRRRDRHRAAALPRARRSSIRRPCSASARSTTRRRRRSCRTPRS